MKKKTSKSQKGKPGEFSVPRAPSVRLHPVQRDVEMKPSPSLEAWRKLYRLADEIKIVAPWTWMDELQIFAIQVNPNDEIAYCSIMGNGGEYFAISLHLGPEGLSAYNAIQDNIQDPFDLYMNQKCLMLSYDDPDLVKEEDKILFKQLRLNYGGKSGYPLFRFLDPGFEPWFLNEEQAQYLIVALEKIINIAKAVQQDKNFLFNESGFIRLFALDANSTTSQWTTTWIPGWLAGQEIKLPRLDELQVNRIIKNCATSGSTWELDYFYVPALITECVKPYYTQIVLVVDQSGGDKIGFDVIVGDAHEAIIITLMDSMERTKHLPKIVHVYKSDLYDLLEGLSKLFGFTISLVDELPNLSNVRDGLVEAISR